MKIKVRVQPQAAANKQATMPDGALKIWLTARAHEGEANKALVEFLAEIFDTAKSRIRIIKGEKAKDKVIEIL